MDLDTGDGMPSERSADARRLDADLLLGQIERPRYCAPGYIRRLRRRRDNQRRPLPPGSPSIELDAGVVRGAARVAPVDDAVGVVEGGIDIAEVLRELSEHVAPPGDRAAAKRILNRGDRSFDVVFDANRLKRRTKGALTSGRDEDDGIGHRPDPVRRKNRLIGREDADP